MGILGNAMLLFMATAGLCSFACKTPPRPHIVFVLADDLGWNDVSFHGSKQIPTTNIDVIAGDGIILNNYYTQPLCTPSRGALMTGKYPIRIGLQHHVIHADEPWGLPLKEKILPQYLKDLGYTTHIVGKWHLGFFKEAYLPWKRGFDSYFGYYAGTNDYFRHFSASDNGATGLDLHKDGEDVWQYNGTYGTELFTDKAKKIIQEHDLTKPLFLFLSQQSPHSGLRDIDPVQVPEKYTTPLVGIKDEKRRKYAGMVSTLDFSVGEIFDALDKFGMLDNTIFIFSTDNGGALESHDRTRASNFPLRGTKMNLWEGGIRGAAFVWSPLLRHHSGIYNGLMHISDWLPTLLSAVGGEHALRLLNGIDGVDQWQSMINRCLSPRKEILINIDDVNCTEAIRKGDFKLLKGSYFEGKYNGWYDRGGLPIKDGYVIPESPAVKMVYHETYTKFLNHSKAAKVLWRKYGKNSFSAAAFKTDMYQQQLEVKCGPRPIIDLCKPDESHCLFDVVKDPCEFYNIAETFPKVVEELKQAIKNYRTIMVPIENKPPDPRANPKLHGNVWVPWL